MSDYILSLSLSYFKEKKENYIISELMEMLGFNRRQIDELLSILLQKEYIGYINDLLQITTKGITFLISNSCSNFVCQTEEYEMIHINSEKAMPVYQPYVPVKFAKKYNG